MFPVTKDGRLNANSIYTRESLKILQTEFYRHLHSKGFAIQRGVEQEPGAKKKVPPDTRGSSNSSRKPSTKCVTRADGWSKKC